MLPKIVLVLEYKHFFTSEQPENRLDLIHEIPRINLLMEIALLNYELKPSTQLKYDVSIESQVREIGHFCPIDLDLRQQYLSVFNSFVKRGLNPLIFNRAANLFAFEEIVNSDLFIEEDKDFNMSKVEVWDSIFRYLLLVNMEVVKVTKRSGENLTLEEISASAIVLNELLIEENPINTAYRGIKLFEYLEKDTFYGSELKRYFAEELNIEKDRFVYNILSLCFANNQENKSLNFYFKHEKNDSFLDLLSDSSFNNKQTELLLRLKKFPMYKVSEDAHVLMDVTFLFNKLYYSFLNDFWFDYLKPQKNDSGAEKFNYAHYRGVFGSFFESLVGEIIQRSFYHLMYPKPMLFGDLVVKGSNGKIEIADIYVRQNKKVLVGQVKSSSIYDKEKYSGDIDTLYKKNREKFFKDFGVDQTFESIKNILKYSNLFDPRLQPKRSIEFYPIVIVNDKVFQTPLLPNLLHKRFQELLAAENFIPHIIHPLVVTNIADWEYLENALATKKTTIWDTLKNHYQKIDKTIMPPFIYTSDMFIGQGAIVDRVSDKIKSIIAKYSDS